jgi:hypothetical protein
MVVAPRAREADVGGRTISDLVRELEKDRVRLHEASSMSRSNRTDTLRHDEKFLQRLQLVNRNCLIDLDIETTLACVIENPPSIDGQKFNSSHSVLDNGFSRNGRLWCALVPANDERVHCSIRFRFEQRGRMHRSQKEGQGSSQ